MSLQAILRFVHDEQQEAQRRLLEIWEKPLEEKLRKGWSQRFTRIERGPESDTLRAYPDDGESRFREGDLLCLHSGHPIDKRLGRRLSFETEEHDYWVLRDKMALAVLDEWDGAECYADPDTIDLTSYHEQTLADIGSSRRGREILQPLLEGTLQPEFDEADVEWGQAVAARECLNARQAEAVGLAVGAELLACIQGPPGTGKTRVLGLIARLMVERGERVMMTSHTHMAINNALNKIHAQGVPVVKIGRKTQTKGLDSAIPNVDSLAEWAERPEQGYVVGATPFATCNFRLENCEFDTILFDEASQVTTSLALMAMRKGRRYVFIGDQQQLPPVLLSRSILQKNGHSVFSRLTSQDADHTVMLDETYRMNRWLTEWPSRAYYAGRLESRGGNRERLFRLPLPSAMPARLQPILGGEDSCVFVPTRDLSAHTVNRRDAALVAEICATAVAGGLPLEDIGIVTPYRAQGRAIRKLLVQSLGHEAARRIVADTVERMQGQERELIILSLATGDKCFLESVADFFFQPQRLNVSITRAMTRLIIIGPDASGLESTGETAIAIESYRNLLQCCRKVER